MSKTKDKLLAEWFWCDRYDGSSAALMNMECQGVYRTMLTQAWRRGAKLPNEHEAIRRAIRCTPAEWRRAWPTVSRYWREADDGASLVNDTQLEVYAEAKAAQEAASRRGKKGAQARAQARAQAATQAPPEQPHKPVHKDKTPSPSPLTASTPSAGPHPLVQNRPALEAECLTLVEEVAKATDRDPVEVMADAAEHKGVRGSMNPAAMTDARLLNVVLNLRKMRGAKPAEAPPAPSPQDWEAARRRRDEAKGR